MAQQDGSEPEGTPIGQIPLRKVKVTPDGRKIPAGGDDAAPANPMNRLVPYLDLFQRLDDSEIARLSGASEGHAAQLRKQVIAVCDALGRYVDLLPRLADPELMRLTGGSAKTVRFWRLCQPRTKTGAPAHMPDLPSSPISVGTPRPVQESPSTPIGTRIPTGPNPALKRSPTSEYSATESAVYKSGESGVHAAVPSSGRLSSADSGSRTIAGPSPRTRSAGESSSTFSVPVSRQRPPSSPEPKPVLGVSGAPFPGYDFDPNEAAQLDAREDGIVIGLDLPDADETDMSGL